MIAVTEVSSTGTPMGVNTTAERMETSHSGFVKSLTRMLRGQIPQPPPHLQ